MCCAADSPASRLRPPAFAKDKMTTDGSGPSLYGRFAALAPDGSWEKTCEVYSLWEGVLPSEKFSETWPSSGTMRSGVCSQRPTSARPTSASASGSRHGWPTPKANDPEKRGDFDPADPRTGLPGAVKLWSTARAEDGERGQNSQFDGLTEDARSWATPTVDDANNVTRASGSQQSLARDTHQWATPTSRDHKDCGDLSGSMVRQNGNPRDDTAPRQAMLCAGTTPSPPEATTAPSDSSPPAPRRAGLNPRFGLWLMAYPVAWLDCVVSVTRSSRRAPLKSSATSPPASD
jgi:hypothetical protein